MTTLSIFAGQVSKEMYIKLFIFSTDYNDRLLPALQLYMTLLHRVYLALAIQS